MKLIERVKKYVDSLPDGYQFTSTDAAKASGRQNGSDVSNALFSIGEDRLIYRDYSKKIWVKGSSELDKAYQSFISMRLV